MLNFSRTTLFRQIIQKRTLFTDEFLGVTFAKEKQSLVFEALREKNVDIKAMRQSLIDSIKPSANAIVSSEGDNVPNQDIILSDDIEQFILTSTNQRQLEIAGQLLRSYVMSKSPGVTNVRQRRMINLLKCLSSICHFEKDMNTIEPLLKDEEFLERIGYIEEQTGLLNQNVPVIYAQYLDYLYESKKYEQVIEELYALQGQIHVLVSVKLKENNFF